MMMTLERKANRNILKDGALNNKITEISKLRLIRRVGFSLQYVLYLEG